MPRIVVLSDAAVHRNGHEYIDHNAGLGAREEGLGDTDDLVEAFAQVEGPADDVRVPGEAA